MSQVDQGNVQEVTIMGTEVQGKYRNEKTQFHTTVPAELSRHVQDPARQGRQHHGEGRAERKLADVAAATWRR